MALDLKHLTQSLKDSSPRTRMLAIGGALLVVVALAVSSVLASRPHFVLLHSQVTDSGRVAVEKALASAGIRYRISQPPGPYVIDVDQAQFYEAQNAVALAGAMQLSSSGIEVGASGASTVFMTSAERAQTMQKREWQELESQLTCLEFVASAKVTTSVPDLSPLRARKPVTVSVTLTLRGQSELTAEQAENVARIVRYRFDVPGENIVVTDQKGQTLYAGEVSGDSNVAQRLDRADHARSFERAMEIKANDAIRLAYGVQKGFVTLATEWDYDLRTIDADVLDPKGVLVNDDKTETVTPSSATDVAPGGAAGTASNLGVDSLTGPPAPAVVAPATSLDQKRVYDIGRTKTRTVHSSPTLKRMSVSLVLDESLASKKDEISQYVEAIVGFQATREDVLRVSTTAIAVPTDAVTGTAVPGAAAEGLSPTLQLLLKHGIEIMAGAVFLFFALKVLRGAKRGALAAINTNAPTPSGGHMGAFNRGLTTGADGDDVEPDPELIARVRVEELVRSDPRRVGEILSRWATETTKTAGSSR